MPRSKGSSLARYTILASACLILVLQAGASRMLRIDEQKISIPELHKLPWQMGPWRASVEQSIGASIETYLKPDEYILRDYSNAQAGANINLFIAYFKSLQNSYGPHSPSVCLPGAGWLVTSSQVVTLAVPGRPDGIPVNKYTMENHGARMLVVYWYQNDRDTWAEEFHAKLRLLPDLVRYRRSDVSLVRLIVPMLGPSSDSEFDNSRQFAQNLFPLLAQHFASVH